MVKTGRHVGSLARILAMKSSAWTSRAVLVERMKAAARPTQDSASASAHTETEQEAAVVPRSLAFDPIQGRAALAALRKRGVDALRSYRDVLNALSYVRGLGYTGPRKEAGAFLCQLLDRDATAREVE